MVSIGEKVTFECLDNPPPSGSSARTWFDDESSHAHIMDACLLMQYANLSGFDHVRALVALIRTPTVRSTSLVTVTRGAIESFARSFYLLGAADALELMHRQLSLLYSDLRYPAHFGETIKTRDGDPLDPTQKRAFYLSELSRLRLPSPAPIEIGRAVAELLDSEFDDGQGKLRYSAMSAVAHSHRLAVNEFVVTNDTGGVSGLVAPRDVVMELAVESLAAMSGTMDAFVRRFGSQSRHVELVRDATNRLAECLSILNPDAA
jgi:hypothetical protein